MPLNRPALSLGSGPRGVQDARRWVVDTCHDIGRSDLVECAELGVSELVTNALLHAAPPISVRVRGTREHPRIEVRDGTTELPLMPDGATPEDDDLLLTFGRGLSIVARCSTAWGVAVEEDGKVVWFVPADRSRDRMTRGVVSGEPPPPSPEPTAEEVVVELLAVPLRAFADFWRHYRELRREVRLLALAHEGDYPLARDLTQVFGDLDRDLREGFGTDQVDRALSAGATVVDLRVAVPRPSATTIGRFAQLLDQADDFCREERLLSLARTDGQRDFEAWFLGEFVRQQEGGAPTAWQDAAVPQPQASS